MKTVKYDKMFFDHRFNTYPPNEDVEKRFFFKFNFDYDWIYKLFVTKMKNLAGFHNFSNFDSTREIIENEKNI